MSDQFISAITDEAMSRICYDGGWNLTPYMFFVSETDVFEGWSESQIFNEDGTPTEEAKTFLKTYTTVQMQNDYTSGNVWYSNQFSSVSQANSTTLTHHINIPGDIAIDTTSKEIKTIFFIYKDHYDQDFLYALARSNSTLIFEHGVTQSFFFNFTVTNADTQDMTNFILNYSCAHEIEDHNTTFGPQIHSNLVARDGSRDLTGILTYTGIDENDFTNDNQLVSKGYVDQYVEDYILPMLNQQICPPGTLGMWPGQANTVPSGWAIRMGQWLNIKDNPGLYKVIGTRYGSRTSGGQQQFRLMDDRGLFIRYSEYNGSSYNYSTLNGVSYGQVQSAGGSVTIPHDGYNIAPGHGTETYRKGWLIGVSGRNEISEYLESIGAMLSDRTVSISNAYPRNRNYLPIIRLG